MKKNYDIIALFAFLAIMIICTTVGYICTNKQEEKIKVEYVPVNSYDKPQYYLMKTRDLVPIQLYCSSYQESILLKQIVRRFYYEEIKDRLTEKEKEPYTKNQSKTK